jgi:hypothetical protein
VDESETDGERGEVLILKPRPIVMTSFFSILVLLITTPFFYILEMVLLPGCRWMVRVVDGIQLCLS